MLIRTLTILLTVFLLGAAPALCLGGLIEHACTDCTESQTCSHEEDCLADPCAGPPATRSSDQGAASAMAPPIVVSPARAGAVEPTRAARPVVRCAGHNLPRPPSDLPLLI